MGSVIGITSVAANGDFLTAMFIRRPGGDDWDVRVRVDRPLAGGRWQRGPWRATSEAEWERLQEQPQWRPVRRGAFLAPGLRSALSFAARYRAYVWERAAETAERWQQTLAVAPVL